LRGGEQPLQPTQARSNSDFRNDLLYIDWLRYQFRKDLTAMMSQEQNDLITRTGPKEPCGKLMRMYWQPAALVDELQGPRPVRPVKLLGENLVLFRDEQGRYGLIERHCAHRGADLAFGRLENGGLRCAFHG
jgi:hypothetical protein